MFSLILIAILSVVYGAIWYGGDSPTWNIVFATLTLLFLSRLEIVSLRKKLREKKE